MQERERIPGIYDLEVSVDAAMRRALVIALLAWVALLLIASAVRERHRPATSLETVELPAHPDAIEVKRHRVATTDWQSVQYKVRAACPSDQIHRFYDEWFLEHGWHRLSPEKPVWRNLRRGRQSTAVFAASWADRDELRRADLRIACTQVESGASEMDISCVAMRALIPRRREPSGPAPLPR